MQPSDSMPENGRREFLRIVGAGVLGLAAHSAALTADKAGSKPMRGVFPIGQTPFTEDDKLDLDCLAAEVKFCNRGGVHGFAWPQIASGWSTLSAQERFSGAEAILAAGKGGKLALAIGVQTQGADLAASSKDAKDAAAHGADAIVSGRRKRPATRRPSSITKRSVQPPNCP